MKGFENLLDNDEEIKWVNGVEKIPYILKKILSGNLITVGIIIYLLIFIVNVIINFINDVINLSDYFLTPLYWTLLVWIIYIIIRIILDFIEASNEGLCITNKRIIKRSGVFNIDFISYSLKNIGTISVRETIVDKKGENASGDINITVKDYHNSESEKEKRLFISSLKNVYESYKLLQKLTEGNNESLRVKTVDK